MNSLMSKSAVSAVSPAPRPPARPLPRRQTPALLWPVLGLIALLVLNAIYAPAFFRLSIHDGYLYGALVDVLNQGAKVALLAIGMTFVIATGGVDLSVGAVMAFAGAAAALLVTQTTMAFVWVVPLCLIATSLIGTLNGVLVACLGLQPLIATLVVMVSGRGVAMLLTGGQIITFEHAGFVYLANGHFLGLPFTVTLVAVVFCGAWLLTRRTAVGLFVEAVGDGERASNLCGVPAQRIKILVYAASGACAGLAGLLAASNIKAAEAARAGEMMELDAIFAVVVGGTALTGGRFTLAGSLTGALLMQLLTVTMYNLGVAPAVAPVPKALIILAVCLVQSEKLRGVFQRLSRRTAP